MKLRQTTIDNIKLTLKILPLCKVLNMSAKKRIQPSKSEFCSCLPVNNMFLGLHVNYIVNYGLVLQQLKREYNITECMMVLLSGVYDLLQYAEGQPHRKGVKLVKRKELTMLINNRYSVNVIYDNVRIMTERNILLCVRRKPKPSQPTKADNFGSASLYDIAPLGIVICRRYSELMQRLYKETKYTRQAKRVINKAISGEIVLQPKYSQAKEIQTPTPPEVESLEIDLLKVYTTQVNKIPLK